MQTDEFSHSDLYRRARRAHERRAARRGRRPVAAAQARDGYVGARSGPLRRLHPCDPLRPGGRRSWPARRRSSSPRRRASPGRPGGRRGRRSMHGVTHTIERIREHGVPGWEVEVIGTDPRVDRRLPAVAEVEVPFYAGLEVGVPSAPGARPDARRGPLRPAPPRLARSRRRRRGALRADRGHARWSAATTPSSPHMRASAPATRGSRAECAWPWRSSTASASVVLSPSPAADQSLLGTRDRVRAHRPLGRAVSTSRFTTRPSVTPARFPAEVKVLYAGRLTKEKGVDLLADAFLRGTRARSAAASPARRRRPGGGALRLATRAAGSAHARPSWAGWIASSWPAPTQARTCSCSARAPTPTAR